MHIGDRAKNVCESAIYMVHRRDVRHTDLTDINPDCEHHDTS